NCGWLWYPGRIWGPGWVNWCTVGNWVGWAPINPWGAPCVVARPIGVGNVRVDPLAWSFMRQSNFVTRDSALVVGLNRARGIPVQQAALIRDPSTLVAAMPRAAQLPGRQQTPWAPAPAAQRAQFLAQQSLPRGFHVGAADPFAARSSTAARGTRV